MKKLLDLLNQMLEEKGKDYRFISIVDCDFFQIDWKNWLWYETILSKKFWFIERLCEKEKIDWYRDPYWIHLYKFWDQKFISEEKELIMELSIQENPVEFLISILK